MRFGGTEATVRRALAQTFPGLVDADGVWRGTTAPYRTTVEVEVVPFGAEAAVRVRADVLPAAVADTAVARAVLLENETLLFGRFLPRDGRVVVEQLLLGGHTLHPDEVRLAVWMLGWAAGAYRDRLAARIATRRPEDRLPAPGVQPRRGAEDRIASTEERVERFLRERYGTFERDPAWGYHGAFGSARVFVSIDHVLEVSTAVLVASPILTGVDLTDALADDALAVMAAHPLGRLAYVGERRELWVEHGVLGDDLDRRELESAIDGVAKLADGEDDRLQAAHGGRRYADPG